MSQVLQLPDNLELRPEPQRDQWKRYRLPHPETGQMMSWTRATTWAGALDEGFNLQLWKQRMTALGLSARPDLLQKVGQIVDPEEDAARAQLNGLVTEALDWAGGSVRSILGFGVHTYLEAIDGGYSDEIAYRVATHSVHKQAEKDIKDVTTRQLTLGRVLTLLQSAVVADVAAYRAKRTANGIRVHPKYVERICILPGIGAYGEVGGIAGTLDRICMMNGKLIIADVKSGSWSETFAAGKIAIQLALYARSKQLWNPTKGVYEPMPEVDQEKALVFEVEAAKGACRLLEVDIAAGWEMVELCGDVRDWRRRRDLVVPLQEV